ncbi:amino acid ABC transporter permease [Pseudomonas syringae]|uniref:Amino acid ABC transporter permease n=5 Tax=Pseudomonas syringae TaxID=317 RepID=A0A3M4L3C1_PSESF|nr:amino acid ABC transporter permease [Pseudomonas syringae]EPM44154.1 amino acid ABC transporter permease [Pseudomonas syringae pv. actinidiae ICMP 19098]EPN15199.1 amino acid ABC transporter permease [Pseudomonas syringae pv. actinidiae ICMP 19100]EPN23667.1 amino acid ABC transporter permease [Pseudomonas syringae pv. actinidiae ICMP 19099]EPN31227.1 amino acid ABC transporter permease [Pseudomonas syringae pv. actinidiae ICMP 18883]EPN36080.1 amino acid ABC transporter permease [Pseudomon
MYQPPGWLQELWTAREVLWSGFLTSIQCSALAIVAGTLIGMLAGLVLTYGGFFARLPIRLYVDLIRGTPVFVLVLAVFYMVPALGWHISAFQAGAIGLTLFCGSHVSEIVRGALQAIPRGQIEAGKAIGLRFNQTLRYLLLPQAMRQILPTWVNSSTEIVKASTLLSVIGVAELLLSTQQVIARTFMTLEFYLFAGFLFFLINYAIELLGRQIEKRVALP